MKSKKIPMKKFIKTLLALSIIACALSIFSCADADGLHNQNALMVTFEFKGFGKLEGNFALPGDFDGKGSWDNTNTDVSLKNGEGISVKVPVTSSYIKFTLVPVGSWTRTWYAKGVLEGNDSDGGVMQNFYIENLDLDAGEATVLVDCSSGTATLSVQ